MPDSGTSATGVVNVLSSATLPGCGIETGGVAPPAVESSLSPGVGFGFVGV
jgi:hypothetical protein